MLRRAATLALFLAAGCSSTVVVPRLPPSQSPAQTLVSPVPAQTLHPSPRIELLGPSAVAGEFLALLQGHQFGAAERRFDRAMFSALSGDRLVSAWTSVERGAGKVVAVDIEEVSPRPPRTHVWFTCEFENRAWNIEVVVNAARKVSGLRVVPVPPPWTAPEYSNVGSLTERAISIGSPPLAGVLTAPVQKPDYAVVLVHGSGPQDEDASVGPRGKGNKMFKDLAWGLASRGIAVVRYPKRTWAYPEQFEGKAFTLDDEVTQDACLGAEVAAQQNGLAPDHVFLVAHSLGAALAPRIATACPNLGGLVLLAGPSRTLDQVLFDQFEYLLALAGKNRKETASELEELLAGFSSALSPQASLGEELSFSGMRAPRSYWIDVARYNPSEAIASAPRLPLLFLQGARDYQVRPPELDLWKRALRGRANASFRLYPALDHRFVAGEGLPTPADYGRPGHVAKAVVDDIAIWIKQKRLPGA